MPETLLDIQDLVTTFRTDAGVVRAVDGLSLSLAEGGALGIVGESGCGKSVTALSILRLISEPGRIESGRILFRGHDLLRLSDRAMRDVRGNQISMIFQEPMTSLNPVYTVGAQIGEAVQLHQKVGSAAARDRAIEMLKLVGIPAPRERVDAYPHQLSGGMRQRVMIAMALACEPALLIADEPTTALDVTIQAQILELLRSLRKRLGMSIILITHDLGVVAEFVDRVVVMYAGQAVESAPVDILFAAPAHPYTRGLLRSIPSRRGAGATRLPTIPGMVPDLAHLPTGCRFQDRCPDVFERCHAEAPVLVAMAGKQSSRCFLSERVAA